VRRCTSMAACTWRNAAFAAIERWQLHLRGARDGSESWGTGRH